LMLKATLAERFGVKVHTEGVAAAELVGSLMVCPS
jgi:hypothetical protein